MVTNPLAQWAFTIVFSATAMYAFCRMVVDRRHPVATVGNALHVVMSIDMVAMAWPVWSSIDALPQILVFSAGTGWYLIVAGLSARRALLPSTIGGHGAWHQIAHALMMLTMVWMTAAMQFGSSDPMDMGNQAASEGMHMHSSLSTPVTLGGIALTGGLVVAGVVMVVELLGCLRNRTRSWLGHTGDLAAGAVMSLGMAAMCWLMLG